MVLLGDAAGDGEAEAVTGLAWVESDKAFEDALTLVFGHAGSVVCDERLDVSVPSSYLHFDSASGLDGGKGVLDEAFRAATQLPRNRLEWVGRFREG